MNSLNHFSTLTESEAAATVGGNWKTELLKYIAEQAGEHIDDIIHGFNAGNHRIVHNMS